MVRQAQVINQYAQWDRRYLWHPFTQQFEWEKETPLIINSGKGAYLHDIKGNRYLDGVSSLWVNLHGHRHPVLDRALKKQIDKISHSTFLGLSHVPAIELARDLAWVAPTGLTRSFFSDNGATAVEAALKMAFQYWIEKATPGNASTRQEFLALEGSYHGDTIGAVSVGGVGAFHSKFKPLLFKTNFAMAPACFRCPFNKKKIQNRFRLGEKISEIPRPGLRREETGCRWECLASVKVILQSKGSRIAAGVIEPVMQGAGGMRVMPPGYVAGFRRLLSQHKVLMIADEVATGFCRTGSLFAVQQEKVSPDFLCLAKAITGGYSPLAVTMTTEKIFQAFRAPYEQFKTFFHGHSYTAHPLGCVVARASLKLIDRTKLLEKTRRKAHLLKDELETLLPLPHVGSIRQAGLMAGVELVQEKRTNTPYPATMRMGNRVCKRLLRDGIWLRPLGNVIVVMPPPVMADTDVRRLVRSVKEAILHECGD
ncbi:MAG: L-Lysine--8-amino-7-oxononanoate transaminase [Elusimicrobia bacterium]|nr:L-Lysine--8-amino-7-oxononanoate transaminase [Elusimicrobiota bacterium]